MKQVVSFILILLLVSFSCDDEEKVGYCVGTNTEGKRINTVCPTSSEECELKEENNDEGLNWTYTEGKICPSPETPDDRN